MMGWWFGGDALPHGDGRLVRIGETLTIEGPLVVCSRGLHLSERALDALQYAQCDTVWRVEVPEGAEVLRGNDKLCVSARRHIYRLDAGPILRAFARQCALNVGHLWTMPSLVRQYLETGDESLRDAAWAAAWDVAWAAARDTARAAARDAARDAAWDAAWAAARDAAWDVAWAVARDAARDAQAVRLDAMLFAALPGAEGRVR